MVKYYILIKRKGAKKWTGAIPARRGVSLGKIKSIVSKSMRKGYSARVVSEQQLKRYLLKSAPKSALCRPIRRVKRRKKRTVKRRKKKR